MAIKAISLPQPLPWIIFRYHGRDPMRVINLDNSTDYTGVLWIHAGPIDEKIFHYVEKALKIILPKPNKFQPVRMRSGGYVGFVHARSCSQGARSRWASSAKWNLVFDDPYPMPFIPLDTAPNGLFDFRESSQLP